jgi:excisionase family DNA binding protein
MSADLNGNEGHDLKWAAARLGLSPHTVRALARRRELSHVRIGRRLVFYEGDLAAYVARHRVEARAEAAGR